jgi:hypothetical protein
MKTDLHPQDEPKGWHELQQKALAERDSEKLEGLLRRMNQILTNHEYETKKRERLTGLTDGFETASASFFARRGADGTKMPRQGLGFINRLGLYQRCKPSTQTTFTKRRRPVLHCEGRLLSQVAFPDVDLTSVPICIDDPSRALQCCKATLASHVNSVRIALSATER